MNEEMVLKLARDCGATIWRSYKKETVNQIGKIEFGSAERFLAFANACCEYQRESDAKICEATPFEALAKHDAEVAAKAGFYYGDKHGYRNYWTFGITENGR